MRIKKTSQYIEGGAGLPSYFTDEIDTGMKWIDGKPIYRKVMIETIKSDYTESGTFYSFIKVPFVDELTSSVSGWITASTGTRTDINSRVRSIGYNPNIDGVKTITINFSSSDSSFIGQIVTIIIEYTKTTD